MHCPFCNHSDTRVVDSRMTGDGVQIRRRRSCEQCSSRFSTLETAMLRAPNVVKSDGRREPFSEEKLRAGMLRSLEKRPVNTGRVEQGIRELLVMIRSVEEAEIPSSLIGEWVMGQLRKLDQVAYVRFASVYRRFEDVSAFREAVDKLEREGEGDDSRQISLLSKPRKSG